MRSRAVKEFRGTPEEASYIKYLSNLWNAVRVAFVNEFGNAIGHPQSEKDLQKINDITGFIFDQRSYLRYGRAYGGHCLPKDSRAFIGWHAKSAKLPLLEGMQASNKIQETLEKEYPLMPEWYSKWPDRHLSGQRALKELWQVAQKYLDHPEAVFNRFRGEKNA